jgi:tetratricopeptide (TPR) repeat protein
MTGVGRVVGLAVALITAAFMTAARESFSAAHCEANAAGNQQALQSLNALLGKNRDNTSVLLARARCFYFLGNYAQAVQDMSEVLRREPKQAEAHLVRGKSLKMLGRIPQALQDYSAAIAIRPTADAYYGRGLTYLREFRGAKHRDALNDFTEAIKLDADHVGAHLYRAQIYSHFDQFQQALEDSEIVLKLAPDTPNANCNLGLAHYALGHDQEGRQFLNACYRKDPDPQTRGYYETEVNKVMHARQPRRGGGGYNSAGSGKTPYDQEAERQQRVIDSLRNSGFKSRAEACRMDSSKC